MYPERRRHKRYLTLRTFSAFVVVSLFVFAAITVRSEMRGRHMRDYGRIVERQLDVRVPQKPIEVVKEATPHIDDQTVADPMLVAPMAREQWMHGELQPAPAPLADPYNVVTPRDGESRITIVGGPEGVAVVEQKRRKPVLAGGFGR